MIARDPLWNTWWLLYSIFTMESLYIPPDRNWFALGYYHIFTKCSSYGHSGWHVWARWIHYTFTWCSPYIHLGVCVHLMIHNTFTKLMLCYVFTKVVLNICYIMFIQNHREYARNISFVRFFGKVNHQSNSRNGTCLFPINKHFVEWQKCFAISKVLGIEECKQMNMRHGCRKPLGINESSLNHRHVAFAVF